MRLNTKLVRPMLMAIALALVIPGPAMAGSPPQGTPARPLAAPIQTQATAGDCPATSTTNLLFPFVSNQAGFDTGISISNTSADPFGTATTAGTCRIHYYGVTGGGGAAPASQTTTSAITAGATANFTLVLGGSHGIFATPGFQGYIIAVCNFPLASGYAFISDVGARNLASGYLAQPVCSDRTKTP